MKLRKLFTAAVATAALSLSLAFTANAELIKQSFDVEYDGGTATLEIAAKTENADPLFDTEFLWEDDAIEYFSISDLTFPGAVDALDMVFSGDDMFSAFNFFSASAYLDAVSGAGEENGFFEVVFELNLDVLDDMLSGIVDVAIFNDSIGIDGFFFGFEDTIGDFEGDIFVSPGLVEVSAPTTALLMLLSIGGLLVARRK
jgi:hypothetical protein